MDFKITLVLRNVAYGDVESILDAVEPFGPDFDEAKGDFVLSLSEGSHERNSWFSSEDFENRVAS